MPRTNVIATNRRKLLLGIASVIAVSVFPPVIGDLSDDIVIQNGWLLKKGDF